MTVWMLIYCLPFSILFIWKCGCMSSTTVYYYEANLMAIFKYVLNYIIYCSFVHMIQMKLSPCLFIPLVHIILYFLNQPCAGHMPGFLKLLCWFVRMFVCMSAPRQLTSDVMRCNMDSIWLAKQVLRLL